MFASPLQCGHCPSKKKGKGTEASSFFNELYLGREFSSYLEIGVANGATIGNVRCIRRTAVDPKPLYSRLPARGIKTIRDTSDKFFSDYCGESFDAIYLDGLHHFDQTLRDLRNATKFIKPSGVILIDDVIPIDEYSALTPQEYALSERWRNINSLNQAWHGDVFKIILLFSSLPSNFLFGTIAFKKNPKTFLICLDGDWGSFPDFTEVQLNRVQKTSATSIFDFNDTVPIPDVFRPMEVNEAIQSIKKKILL